MKCFQTIEIIVKDFCNLKHNKLFHFWNLNLIWIHFLMHRLDRLGRAHRIPSRLRWLVAGWQFTGRKLYRSAPVPLEVNRRHLLRLHVGGEPDDPAVWRIQVSLDGRNSFRTFWSRRPARIAGEALRKTEGLIWTH